MGAVDLKPWGGARFRAVDVGPFRQLERFSYTLPSGAITLKGKLFLSELLTLTGAEVSLNKLSPMESMPFFHRHHKNEEVYVILSGEGQFQVDDRVFPVTEGTIVRVDPAGDRAWRNTSETADLLFIVIQAPAGGMEAAATSDGEASETGVGWI